MANASEPPDNPAPQERPLGEVAPAPHVEPIQEQARARLKPRSLEGMYMALFRPDEAYALLEIDCAQLSKKMMTLETGEPEIANLQIAADKQFDFIAERVKRLDDRRSTMFTIAAGLLAGTPTILQQFVGNDFRYFVIPLVLSAFTAFCALWARRPSRVGSAMDVATWLETTSHPFDEATVSRGRLAGTMDAARGQIAAGDLIAAQLLAITWLVFFSALAIGVTAFVGATRNPPTQTTSFSSAPAAAA